MANEGYYPQEFGPELTEAFYKKMARPIEERGKQRVGEVRGEALRRGMVGDPFEALGVSGARGQTSQELSNLYAGLGMEGAGRAREERLIGEGYEFQTGERVGTQEFESEEAQKQRAFQENMARIYNQFRQDEAKTKYRRGYQEALWGVGASAVSAMIPGIGPAVSGLFAGGGVGVSGGGVRGGTMGSAGSKLNY